MLSLNVITQPSKVVVIDKKMMDEFFKLENVDDVAPMAGFGSQISFGQLNGSVNIQGVDAKYFKYAGVVAKEGALFGDGERDSCVISSAVAKLFQAKPEELIGQRVSFKVFVPALEGDELQEVPIPKEFQIKGIIEDEAALFAYVPLGELSSRFVIPYYEKARVKVSSQEALDPTEAKILEKGFIVTSLSKTVDQANKIFQGIQAMLAIFGGIALVVSAIGMFNTMTVTLLERTREIGIMRTIGGSPLKIKIMFLTESVMMGTLGGVVGILIGVGGGLTVNFLLSMVAQRMGGTPMALFRFPLPFLTFIAVFSAIMGYLTGLFPSSRAGSLNPLDAIRS
jgi:putative ABC transport system permease protein